MSSNSPVEEKLKDLNLTNDELKRFTDAFKNEEFRKLFIEYAEELNDPTNRALYEQEIRTVEEERGSNVTFVHPKPGHVIKTIINGTTKCFINIATNENVDKPSFNKTNPVNGEQGAQWSLPHCLAGPHEEVDHDSKSCTVYDVVFSPDTYRMAETNGKFMNMLEESALDSVENNYQCKLDRNNVKRLKMKFKGVPKATIIRKKKEDQQQETRNNAENELKNETDEIIDKAITAAQNHKVVLSSHNRSVNPPPSTNTDPSELNPPRSDENGFTIPTYRIVHRGEFDMQDCTNSLLPQVRSMRPKELILEIDLPLCASSSNVDLDVCERSIKLHCDSPKYSLDLPLPYPVRESDSHARFDKKQRKLIVTLAVIKEIPSIIELNTNFDMEETSDDATEITTTTDGTATPIENTKIINYTFIPFEYKQGLAHIAFVLQVKNADKTSLKIENDGQHITIQLASLGSGFYPLFHQLCLDFDEPMIFDTTENSTAITFNEDNVLILLKKATNNQQLTKFFSGLNRDDMKVNYFVVLNPVEKLSTQPITKEDFLLVKSDLSTSSNSEQHKKLSKKQAKKMAKENRKGQVTDSAMDEGDKLVNKISKITLQSTIVNHDEQKSDITNESRKTLSEEKDDKLLDMPVVVPRPSVYRRHMSESQVDREPASNGEFKLKGILKYSTKYRSLSESLNEPFDQMNHDFQREESVFESCPGTDDLTSSNENNSIVTSPDSASSSLCTTPNSSVNVKHVTFNNQVSRKTFKPGGPVSGMKKVSSTQQRKLKKRKRQDSLNSQSSDQDDSISSHKTEKAKTKQSDDYKNPVEFEDVISWQAAGSGDKPLATKSAMSDIDKIDLDIVITKTQYALYEYHFAQADPHDHGIVSSIEANNYFQRSHLKPDQLKIIWNLADPHGRGYLDRRAFYIALKLIALAQSSLDFHDYSNITKDIIPPNLNGDIPQSVTLFVADAWTIGPTARCTFDRAFEKLSGTMNKLPGSSVKPIFLKSGLTADQLHKIWELSDIDEDGALDRNEFAIAMFLIHGLKSSAIRELPERLPSNLMPVRMRRISGVESGINIPNVMTNANTLSSIVPSQISPSKRTDDHWIVSLEEKQKFDILFQQLDLDKDGFITGSDVFQTLLASGLPNFVLSHIWNLCDIGQTGKLNAEQFALASYFISLKLQAPNYQLPMELSHDMIPPSLRPKTFTVNESDNAELQQLLSEVNTLTSEKSLYEVHFNEKQQAVKDKRAELSSLELRSGTANATLVERQQRMTEKQNELNDIQNRKEKTTKELLDIDQQIKEENRLIDQAREKINELSIETDAQQEVRQTITKIREDKDNIESRLLNKQQQLGQVKSDLERYQHIVENQRILLEEYMKHERPDAQAAVAELMVKFKQLVDTPAKSALPSMASKVVIPKQQSQVVAPTSSYPDPFGLPATASNNTFNAFGAGNDPFGTVRPDDPFMSDASSSALQNQKLDDTDPFRSTNFNAALELNKKNMANRSKTPGANMFGGSDFTQSAGPPVNRPQSAMAWEPTRQVPPQPGTQAFSDLFDVFG